MAIEFSVSNTVALLGVSFFVLGFAVGPLVWAPLSEIYGRQVIFLITYGCLTIFDAGCIAAQSPTQIIVLRFFAGVFGSSPLTNSGGVIADMFAASDRGLAMSVFAISPFLGPVLGPIVGGFLGAPISWRWIHVLTTTLTGCLFIVCVTCVPETYAPLLLRCRAKSLSLRTGKVYISRLDHIQGPKPLSVIFKIALSRPWILLFKEPIVLILSIYVAIFYGTVYMFFAAFPIVFRGEHHWSQATGGLAFIGIAFGMAFALMYMLWENKRYNRVALMSPNGRAPPEARLPVCMIAAVVTPIGLFWFAWSNGLEIHWIVCIIGSSLFGFGNVLLTLGCMNYLIDAYVIYAASVMAASTTLRSILGAAFPLFTAKMYKNLGIHWASSVPAFLALICMPFPFLFYHYGAAIRGRCSYAQEAQRTLEEMLKSSRVVQQSAEFETAEVLALPDEKVIR